MAKKKKDQAPPAPPPRQVVVEGARKCGFRKIGGIYLVTDGEGVPCPLLPAPLSICPCCGNGIKFTRGWSWIQTRIITGEDAAESCGAHDCTACGLHLQDPDEKIGLQWIGASFYKTPEEFNREAARMGISRRIKAVPRNFKVGETWVALAHINAIPEDGDRKASAGIFRVFKPTRVEKVFAEGTPEEELQAAERQGFTVALVPNLPRHFGSCHDKEEQLDLPEGGE